MTPERPPWHAVLLLLRPLRVREHLARLVSRGVIAGAPNLWQVELGVLRMWHRVFFRSGSIGTSSEPVRPGTRARLLHFRPLRFPFLVAHRAVAPLDHSGLVQPTARLINHLLTAHHDAAQFTYDLEILRGTDGALADARARVAAVVAGTAPRSELIKDLCVHVGYHERLLAAIDAVLAGRPLVSRVEADDPDISFQAFIRWCSAQPTTPRATWDAWRSGAFPRPVEAT